MANIIYFTAYSPHNRIGQFTQRNGVELDDQTSANRKSRKKKNIWKNRSWEEKNNILYALQFVESIEETVRKFKIKSFEFDQH